MSMYRYIKAPPGYTLKHRRSSASYLKKGLSAIMLTVGVSAFTTVVYPLLYYQLNYAPRLQTSSLLSPVVREVEKTSVAAISQASAKGPTFVPEMINTTLDYTDSQTWFRDEKRPRQEPLENTQYSLSVPKLGIQGATVVTSHSDLKKSLIQYPGTAMPGDLGNTVIFGHSVLPQFFSPTNYISIFSTLHTLTQNDEIHISADGVDYRYRIKDMYEVMPDDLSPLAQTYDRHSLTVITCTPPGTYLRRLIIKAELI